MNPRFGLTMMSLSKSKPMQGSTRVRPWPIVDSQLLNFSWVRYILSSHVPIIFSSLPQTLVTMIEQVFMSASKQKAWDHFSKAQRKNLDLWKKQAQVGWTDSESHMENDRDISVF